MLLVKANTLVEAGRARIIHGRLYLFNPTDVGYDRAPGFARFSGRVSFDPERGGGPQVMQGFRTNRRRKGGSDGVQKIKRFP